MFGRSSYGHCRISEKVYYTNYFRGYNQPQLDTADPWQFKNFLITDGD